MKQVSEWQCLECGHLIREKDPYKCPKCGSYEVDVAEYKPPRPKKKERDDS